MASHTRRFPVSSDKRFRKLPGGGDHGTPERWQHSGRALELTERAGVLAVSVTEEHIIDVLAMRRLLDEVQVQAGLRFKEDYHAAALAAHVTGSYSGMSRGRDAVYIEQERSEAQEAAYKRWKNAVRELGTRSSQTVIATLCHDTPPTPRDIPALQDGLEKLVIWYNIRR